MRLLPQTFSLLFFFKFFKKGRKALFVLTLEFVFMTKIKVITQPFNIISMLVSLQTLLFHKRSVQLGKIGSNLNRKNELIPRSLSKRKRRSRLYGAAGLASESENSKLPYGRRFPAAAAGSFNHRAR